MPSACDPSPLLARLEREFPPDLITRDASDLVEYGRDWTKVVEPSPCAIALPRSTVEVARIVRLCAEHDVAIVPSGDRTGLAGGAVASKGELVVSLSRMRAMGPVDELGASVRVEAGAVTEAVHEHVKPFGLTWPVDFASKGSSTVGGNIVREIHRSPYHADAFIYPVCLFAGSDGRVLLAHCPDSYARIEIDDAETGECLTLSTSRKEPDFFHSRLAVSPSSRRLVSAGWVWHPLDAVVWFDIAAVLRDPALLDALEGATHSRYVGLAEESSAAWLGDDRILLGGSLEPEDPEEVAELGREHTGPRLRPNGLAVYDTSVQKYLCRVELGYPPGTMMPVGEHHVMTFFQHPRLVSLVSGKLVHEWTDIDSGEVVSSIVDEQRHPILALDPSRSRFAVGRADGIDVLIIDPAKLPV